MSVRTLALLPVDTTPCPPDSPRMADKRSDLKKSKKSLAGVTMDFRGR
jgi:hypothetical protein